MKIFISTLGCKVNQYESQAILETFCKSGYKKASSAESADVIIVNSCSVTSESDKKVRKTLHKLRKENPSAIIALVGCLPQAFPQKMSTLSNYADIILGNANKTQILEKVTELVSLKNKITEIKPFAGDENFDKNSISTFDDRTRAFVKIEDGCNRFCSYCIIPYARGRVRSKPLEDITAEVRALAKNGYKEIVLVGINLSAYGSDLNLTLCDAVEKTCAVEGVERVRLGSLEPEYLSENTIKRFAAQKKLCPHFHLSLQSGCDDTLKRMNRHYTSAEYYEIVQNLKKYFKNVAITTDVMVGFAGETDEEFEQSLNFVQKVGFSKVHVFAYSVRNGTKAANFENQVPLNVKKQRSKIIINATENSRHELLRTQVGRVEPVLFEQRDSNGLWIGHTRNYTPVKVNSTANLQAQVVLTKLTSASCDECQGGLII